MKLLTSLLFAVAFFASSSGAVNAQQIRVMTYNILGSYHTKAGVNSLPWRVRRQGVYEVIEDASPDIFALQEDTLEQTNDVSNNIASQYQQVQLVKPLSGSNPSNKSYGSMFYDSSKFEKLDQGEFSHSGSRSGRHAKWVKLRHLATNEILYVANAHIRTGTKGSDDNYNNSISIPEQLASAEKIAKTMWSMVGSDSYILLGDMNNYISAQAIKYHTSNKGTFAGMSYHENHKKLQFNHYENRWNNIMNNGVIRTPPLPTSTVIDHILTSEKLSAPYDFERYNRNFKPTSLTENCDFSGLNNSSPSGRLDNCRESDHQAIMATVRFKKSNAHRYYKYLTTGNPFEK